jgi:hypothetical protein
MLAALLSATIAAEIIALRGSARGGS